MLEKKEFLMPATIKSERQDIVFLTKLFNEILETKEGVFVLNYEKTKFFASELYGFYHYHIKELKKNGINIISINVAENVDYVSHISNKIFEDIPKHNSIILPHEFKNEVQNGDFDSFDRYMKKELLPKFISNDNIRNVITQYLSELFVNSRTHGKTYNIICGGQIYPIKNKIRIVIVDFGVTIPYNVENFIINGKTHYFHKNDGDAIKWSTKEGNSTKQSLGGLGLNTIIEFIDDYKGRLLIISRYGSYERFNNIDKIINTNIKFSGTLIVVELDLTELKTIKKPQYKKEVFSI